MVTNNNNNEKESISKAFDDAMLKIRQEQEAYKNSRHWCRYRLPENINAKEFLKTAFSGATDSFWYHSEYDILSDYLADNQGKGLMLQGNIGTGKTMFVEFVYKPFLRVFYNKGLHSYTAEDLNNTEVAEEMCQMRQLFIDDLGREKRAKSYGTELSYMDKIADNLEKKHSFLICTTNLSTAELIERYGERAVDRMKAYMFWANFGGLTSQRNR